MFYKLLNILDKKISFITVSAKTNYKSYDPLSMQLAVLTMIRSTDSIKELQNKAYLTAEEQKNYIQLLNEKLDNCKKIKHEFVLLWKHLNSALPREQVVSVDELLSETFIDAELNSHLIDRKLSRQLLSVVNKLVEIYWQSKGVKTYFAKCSSPINHSLCIRC